MYHYILSYKQRQIYPGFTSDVTDAAGTKKNQEEKRFIKFKNGIQPNYYNPKELSSNFCCSSDHFILVFVSVLDLLNVCYLLDPEGSFGEGSLVSLPVTTLQ